MTDGTTTLGDPAGGDVVIESVSKSFGGLQALRNVSLTAKESHVTALIGPNGAGKTTLFNVISGALAPDTGTIRLGSLEIQGMPLRRVAARGLVRSFQEVRVFTRLTARENIEVARESSEHRKDKRTSSATRRSVPEILELLGLPAGGLLPASRMSYAEQKFVSLGRMLAFDPDVFLLDEPSSGLDANSAAHFIRLIEQLRTDGKTVVIVEHNLDLVRALADEIAFLHMGELLITGKPEDVLKDPRMQETYLGGQFA
jgi:ABC-type branched-subunit amino acid transport system ATPase component